MGKEILMFGDIEIKKHKLYRYKSPIFSEDVDIDNVLVSNKSSPGKKKIHKYSVDYLYGDCKIKSFHIMLPKIRA